MNAGLSGAVRRERCYHCAIGITVGSHASLAVVVTPFRHDDPSRPRHPAVSSTGSAINPRAISAFVLAISVLVVLAGALAWYHTVNFERELEQSVRDHLAEHGFDEVDLKLDGRDVVFRGEVDARVDRRRMVALARDVEGVENVYDRRVVTNYETGRHFELHSYAGITTVEGELPSDEDIAGVIGAIREHYGVDPLGTDLKVRAAVRRPPWLDRLPALLDAAGAVSPLRIEYGNDQMTVSGEVADAAVRERVTTAIDGLVGEDVVLDVFLRLPSQIKEPQLRIEFKNGQVSVSGTAPEDDFADELVAALALAFAVDEVDNRLRRDPDVRHSDWLEGVLRVVFPLAMTHWMDLEITHEEVVLNGSVAGDDEFEIIAAQIRDNFDYSARVVNRIRRQGGER